MFLSGTGFADDADAWKYTKRDGTYVKPPQKSYSHYTRNTDKHAKETAGPHKQEQKKKGPDPYDERYNSNYRPRFK
jgi:hypothetical protein